MPGPGWATVAISFSFFSITAWSVNLYTMPLDAFGGATRGLQRLPADRRLRGHAGCRFSPHRSDD